MMSIKMMGYRFMIIIFVLGFNYNILCDNNVIAAVNYSANQNKENLYLKINDKINLVLSTSKPHFIDNFNNYSEQISEFNRKIDTIKLDNDNILYTNLNNFQGLDDNNSKPNNVFMDMNVTSNEIQIKGLPNNDKFNLKIEDTSQYTNVIFNIKNILKKENMMFGNTNLSSDYENINKTDSYNELINNKFQSDVMQNTDSLQNDTDETSAVKGETYNLSYSIGDLNKKAIEPLEETSENSRGRKARSYKVIENENSYPIEQNYKALTEINKNTNSKMYQNITINNENDTGSLKEDFIDYHELPDSRSGRNLDYKNDVAIQSTLNEKRSFGGSQVGEGQVSNVSSYRQDKKINLKNVGNVIETKKQSVLNYKVRLINPNYLEKSNIKPKSKIPYSLYVNGRINNYNNRQYSSNLYKRRYRRRHPYYKANKNQIKNHNKKCVSSYNTVTESSLHHTKSLHPLRNIHDLDDGIDNHDQFNTFSDGSDTDKLPFYGLKPTLSQTSDYNNSFVSSDFDSDQINKYNSSFTSSDVDSSLYNFYDKKNNVAATIVNLKPISYSFATATYRKPATNPNTYTFNALNIRQSAGIDNTGSNQGSAVHINEFTHGNLDDGWKVINKTPEINRNSKGVNSKPRGNNDPISVTKNHSFHINPYSTSMPYTGTTSKTVLRQKQPSILDLGETVYSNSRDVTGITYDKFDYNDAIKSPKRTFINKDENGAQSDFINKEVFIGARLKNNYEVKETEDDNDDLKGEATNSWRKFVKDEIILGTNNNASDGYIIKNKWNFSPNFENSNQENYWRNNNSNVEIYRTGYNENDRDTVKNSYIYKEEPVLQDRSDNVNNLDHVHSEKRYRMLTDHEVKGVNRNDYVKNSNKEATLNDHDELRRFSRRQSVFQNVSEKLKHVFPFLRSVQHKFKSIFKPKPQKVVHVYPESYVNYNSMQNPDVTNPGLDSFTLDKLESPYPFKPHYKTHVKHIPVPYHVEVEKKVPYLVQVPYDNPVPVKIPQPYGVPVEKIVPYPVKIEVPDPFPVTKFVKEPYNLYVEHPVPFEVEQPYTVIKEQIKPYTVETLVPTPYLKPVYNRFPVNLPYDKIKPFPVESIPGIGSESSDILKQNQDTILADANANGIETLSIPHLPLQEEINDLNHNSNDLFGSQSIHNDNVLSYNSNKSNTNGIQNQFLPTAITFQSSNQTFLIPPIFLSKRPSSVKSAQRIPIGYGQIGYFNKSTPLLATYPGKGTLNNPQGTLRIRRPSYYPPSRPSFQLNKSRYPKHARHHYYRPTQGNPMSFMNENNLNYPPGYFHYKQIQVPLHNNLQQSSEFHYQYKPFVFANGNVLSFKRKQKPKNNYNSGSQVLKQFKLIPGISDNNHGTNVLTDTFMNQLYDDQISAVSNINNNQIIDIIKSQGFNFNVVDGQIVPAPSFDSNRSSVAFVNTQFNKQNDEIFKQQSDHQYTGPSYLTQSFNPFSSNLKHTFDFKQISNQLSFPQLTQQFQLSPQFSQQLSSQSKLNLEESLRKIVKQTEEDKELKKLKEEYNLLETIRKYIEQKKTEEKDQTLNNTFVGLNRGVSNLTSTDINSKLNLEAQLDSNYQEILDSYSHKTLNIGPSKIKHSHFYEDNISNLSLANNHRLNSLDETNGKFHDAAPVYANVVDYSYDNTNNNNKENIQKDNIQKHLANTISNLYKDKSTLTESMKFVNNHFFNRLPNPDSLNHLGEKSNSYYTELPSPVYAQNKNQPTYRLKEIKQKEQVKPYIGNIGENNSDVFIVTAEALKDSTSQEDGAIAAENSHSTESDSKYLKPRYSENQLNQSSESGTSYYSNYRNYSSNSNQNLNDHDIANGNLNNKRSKSKYQSLRYSNSFNSNLDDGLKLLQNKTNDKNKNSHVGVNGYTENNLGWLKSSGNKTKEINYSIIGKRNRTLEMKSTYSGYSDNVEITKDDTDQATDSSNLLLNNIFNQSSTDLDGTGNRDHTNINRHKKGFKKSFNYDTTSQSNNEFEPVMNTDHIQYPYLDNSIKHDQFKGFHDKIQPDIDGSNPSTLNNVQDNTNYVIDGRLYKSELYDRYETTPITSSDQVMESSETNNSKELENSEDIYERYYGYYKSPLYLNPTVANNISKLVKLSNDSVNYGKVNDFLNIVKNIEETVEDKNKVLNTNFVRSTDIDPLKKDVIREHKREYGKGQSARFNPKSTGLVYDKDVKNLRDSNDFKVNPILKHTVTPIPSRDTLHSSSEEYQDRGPRGFSSLRNREGGIDNVNYYLLENYKNSQFSNEKASANSGIKSTSESVLNSFPPQTAKLNDNEKRSSENIYLKKRGTVETVGTNYEDVYFSLDHGWRGILPSQNIPDVFQKSHQNDLTVSYTPVDTSNSDSVTSDIMSYDDRSNLEVDNQREHLITFIKDDLVIKNKENSAMLNDTELSNNFNYEIKINENIDEKNRTATYNSQSIENTHLVNKTDVNALKIKDSSSNKVLMTTTEFIPIFNQIYDNKNIFNNINAAAVARNQKQTEKTFSIFDFLFATPTNSNESLVENSATLKYDNHKNIENIVPQEGQNLSNINHEENLKFINIVPEKTMHTYDGENENPNAKGSEKTFKKPLEIHLENTMSNDMNKMELIEATESQQTKTKFERIETTTKSSSKSTITDDIIKRKRHRGSVRATALPDTVENSWSRLKHVDNRDQKSKRTYAENMNFSLETLNISYPNTYPSHKRVNHDRKLIRQAKSAIKARNESFSDNFVKSETNVNKYSQGTILNQDQFGSKYNNNSLNENVVLEYWKLPKDVNRKQSSISKRQNTSKHIDSKSKINLISAPSIKLNVLNQTKLRGINYSKDNIVEFNITKSKLKEQNIVSNLMFNSSRRSDDLNQNRSEVNSKFITEPNIHEINYSLEITTTEINNNTISIANTTPRPNIIERVTVKPIKQIERIKVRIKQTNIETETSTKKSLISFLNNNSSNNTLSKMNERILKYKQRLLSSFTTTDKSIVTVTPSSLIT